MKISTEIGSIAKISGMERAVELCAKAGFDAWDLSMFDMCRIDSSGNYVATPNGLMGNNCLKFARSLRRIGEDNGIVCNQSHAPFPVRIKAIEACLERAIECTAEAGGEICVIHPDNNKSAEQNAEMYARLLPIAKACNVRIAAENMWNWDHVANCPCHAACSSAEDFIKHIDILDDPYLVACLDIGHAQMRTAGDGAVNMIRKMGRRIQALHLHDNDLLLDHHQLPFSMNIDFFSVVRALKEIDYSGYFTLEAKSYLETREASELLDGVKTLKDSAQRLADMFDEA
ncbi:MAG: sugar phosphate isomerase/epimerase [Clostridia bacterium]|nr:sugar phosphate isomerase/epimerase [Clostridia bacterium]